MWNNTTFIEDNNKICIYYQLFIPPMLLLCLLSIITNIKVLLSVHWIRRPLTPTLHISLSLAAADACSSAMLGIGLFLNSYLTVWDINSPCAVLYGIEIFRLSGIIITVVHLLTLSINHYMGILKPLRYISIMTTRKVTITVILLWIIPFLLHLIYFLMVPDQTYWFQCDGLTFMNEVQFRYTFTMLFFIPIVLMIFCYTHILIIVRNQQKRWDKLSRCGSMRTRGVKNNNQQKNTLEGNIKAIYTTLLILGSCVVGWLPACLIFLLVCESGCLYQHLNVSENMAFFIPWFINVLIILKTLINPIIYSSRMIEIQESSRRMKLAFKRVLCREKRRDRYDSEMLRLNLRSSPSQAPTTMGRFNGSITQTCVRKSQMLTTLV